MKIVVIDLNWELKWASVDNSFEARQDVVIDAKMIPETYVIGKIVGEFIGEPPEHNQVKVVGRLVKNETV